MTFTTLMKMYVDKGDEQKAEQVLDPMARAKPSVPPNTTTFTTLMKMYVDKGDEQKAEQVLVRMARAKPSVWPNTSYVQHADEDVRG